MRTTAPVKYPDTGVPSMEDSAPQRLYTMVRRPDRAVLDHALEAFAMFLHDAVGAPVHIGERTVSVLMPGWEGDVGWYRGNVDRFEDMVGASSQAAARRRADNAADLYRRAGGEPELIGWRVLESKLAEWCVPYDSWEWCP